MLKFLRTGWLGALVLLVAGCNNSPDKGASVHPSDTPSIKPAAGAHTAASSSKPSGGPASVPPAAETQDSRKTILFFGNSLTAGYGVNPSKAFPALIQERIDSLKLS